MQRTLLTIICSLTLGVVHSRNYTLVGAGACRGNGGASDKVNCMYAEGSSFSSLDSCQSECDDQPTCVGFAYADSLNQCSLYGPDLAGMCSDNADINDTIEKCAAAGSCSNDDTSANCYDGNVQMESCLAATDMCTTLEGTWTSSGYSWTDAETPWNGDSYATTHVHGHNGNPDYACYDADESDGVATCTDGTDTSGCAASFALADDYTDTSCYDCTSCGSTIDSPACTYTAAPEMESEVVVHEASVYAHGSDGYYVIGQSGACRGEGGGAATSKYSQACNVDGTVKECGEAGQDSCRMTQQECRAACDLENYMKPGSCHAYHHGTWCSIFGPDLYRGVGTSSCEDPETSTSTDCYDDFHAIARPTEADCLSPCTYVTAADAKAADESGRYHAHGACWTGYNSSLNIVKETNANVLYICWETCGDLSNGVDNDCVDVDDTYCSDNQYADCGGVTVSAAFAVGTPSFAVAALSAVVAFIF